MQTVLTQAIRNLAPAYETFVKEMEQAIPGFWTDVLKGTIDDYTNPGMGDFLDYTVNTFSWSSQPKKTEATRRAFIALANFKADTTPKEVA